MSDLLQQIKSRGWWHVTVRPTRFDEHHIAHATELQFIVERCAVSSGWSFPQILLDRRLDTGSDWIGQEVDWDRYRELWRFYTSGQFVHIAGILHDWRDRSQIHPPNEGWQPGAGMLLRETAWRLSEIYEFAARLALTPAGDATMHVAVRIEGLSGRNLYDEQAIVPSIYSKGPLVATSPSFKSERDYDRAELIANSRALAADVTRDLLLMFGWTGPAAMVRDWQDQLFGRAGAPTR